MNDKKQVSLILISGVSGSGKTSLADEIIKKIDKKKRICVIDMDGYYDNLPKDVKGEDWNWDSPDAFKNGIHLLTKHIRLLKNGETVKIPKHDYVNYRMVEDAIEISNVEVIIIEGILTLYFKELRDLADMKFYVNCDDDTALARRLIRDVTIRGYDMDLTIRRYNTFVKPAADEFIKPFRKLADIEIPNHSKENLADHLATDLIACYILNRVPGPSS